MGSNTVLNGLRRGIYFLTGSDEVTTLLAVKSCGGLATPPFQLEGQPLEVARRAGQMMLDMVDPDRRAILQLVP